MTASGAFLTLGDKRGSESETLFSLYSDGAITNRDDWIYSSSHNTVERNVARMAHFFNEELRRFQMSGGNDEPVVFVRKDDTRIRVG